MLLFLDVGKHTYLKLKIFLAPDFDKHIGIFFGSGPALPIIETLNIWKNIDSSRRLARASLAKDEKYQRHSKTFSILDTFKNRTSRAPVRWIPSCRNDCPQHCWAPTQWTEPSRRSKIHPRPLGRQQKKNRRKKNGLFLRVQFCVFVVFWCVFVIFFSLLYYPAACVSDDIETAPVHPPPAYLPAATRYPPRPRKPNQPPPNPSWEGATKMCHATVSRLSPNEGVEH